MDAAKEDGTQSCQAETPGSAGVRHGSSWAAVQRYAAPGVYRRITSSIRPWAERAAPLLWLVAGALVGWAWAVMAFSSATGRLGAAAALGLATVGARGLARLTVSAMVALGVVSLGIALDTRFRRDDAWSASWMVAATCAVVVGCILVSRARARSRRPAAEGFNPVLDLAVGVVVLAWALWFAHRVDAVGLPNSLTFFFGGAEDNAAWVNSLALMSSSGYVHSSAVAVDTFGPVVTVVLGAARLFVGSAQLGVSSAATSGLAILTASGWLVALAPLVSLVLATRALRSGRFLRGVLAWFVVSVILGAQAIVLVTYGFLSAIVAALSLVIVVTAVDIVRPLVGSWWAWLTWAAVAVLMFEVGASWFPLIPLGGLAVVVWTALAAGSGLFRSRVPAVLPVAAAVAVGLGLVWVLYDRGAAVLACCGGGDPLVAAEGATPEVAPTVLALGLALLGLGWIASPTEHLASWRRPVLVRSLLVVVGYVVVLAVLEAARTSGGPHYGGKKLLYVVAGTWLAVVLVDLLISQSWTRRPMEMAFALGLAVLAAAAAQGGPLFVAVQSHWPAAPPAPSWSAAVADKIVPGDRVGCLATSPAQPGNDAASLEAYLCSRWAQSVAGADSPESGTWRFMLLGRDSVAAAIPFAHQPGDQPLKLIVIGPTDNLHDPAAWWAPLIAGSKIHVIPTG